ncbi:MAG: TolC family protein [Salegentibacter sp.]
MKSKLLLLLCLFLLQSGFGQNRSLDYFLNSAEQNNPNLQENKNLQKIGQFQNQLINAQNNSVQVDVTSEVMVAPYFNNNGHFIDVTTQPSPDAYGYAEPVTNGALYSAQLNITKDIFNRATVQNLLFQNKLKNKGLQLSSEEIKHQVRRNITNAYIQVYHLQVKEEITRDIISDLQNRLKVVEVLVKNGILMQSDYLLLQLEVENKKLELEQIKNDLNSKFLELNNASGIGSTAIQKLEEPDIVVAPPPQGYLTDSLPSPSDVRRYVYDSLKISRDSLALPQRPIDTAGYHFQRKYRNDSLQLVAEKKVFENKYKPQVSAYGNTGLNAVDLDRLAHHLGFSAGLKLTVPIYDGDQRKINELQNKLKQENLDYRLQNDKLKKKNTLESLQKQMNSIQKSLVLINAQLRKQQNILEIYKGKMVQGQVSIIDYLKVVENYKMNVETRLQMKINLWLLQNEYNATNW